MADVGAVFDLPAARGDGGYHLNDVEKQLGGRYNAREIRTAVERLVNDGAAAGGGGLSLAAHAACAGLLYSTFDEMHYKSTKY